MKLFELAYYCDAYGKVTPYDASLRRFRARVGTELDAAKPGHSAALLAWLNSWGCRQFAKKDHSTIASPALATWAESWLRTLPPTGIHLTTLEPDELGACVDAYDALRMSLASRRRRRPDSGPSDITFGPTGASKTLFAFRPNVFAPWDRPFRDARGFGDGRASFLAYLEEIARQLRALSDEAGLPVDGLPRIVGRPHSSPPKLIDEYNLMVAISLGRPFDRGGSRSTLTS